MSKKVIDAGTIKWAMNDIPNAYTKMKLVLPDAVTRWTYKRHFCTKGAGRFPSASDEHLNPSVHNAVAFLLEPHDAFFSDFQCMSGSLSDNKTCKRPTGYVVKSEQTGRVRTMLLNNSVPLPKMSGISAMLFDNHSTSPMEFMEWLDTMVDWHSNMKSMSITPVFRAHVFMLRWFGELLDTKPLGLRDLQTALAKKMDTPEWRKAVADFLTANSNRLGQTTEAAHFVALVLATVCQLNEGSACTGDPVGYMVSVADLVEWAITKMDGQEVWKTQRVTSTADKPPKRRSKSAASPSPNKKSRQ